MTGDARPDARMEERQSVPDEPPPVLRTWPRVYLFVLVYLACVIVAFYFLTRRLAP
jgi:hypothetical protein